MTHPNSTQGNLTGEPATNFLNRGLTRRGLYKMATLLAAGAALPFYNEQALAQLSQVKNMPPDAVKINANENPMGPCPEAAEAIHAIVAKGGRYLYEETDALKELLAEQEGVRSSYVRPYAGSSQPLHLAVLAFTSKDRPYVVADPGYEAGAKAAEFIGASVIRVPLQKATFAHDVKAMLSAAPNAGLFYICNPNNPTGTLTPAKDIEWLVANKPAGSVVLVDEAYIHLSSAPMSSPLVAADKDVVILRTFSKLYGMAGLRAGAAIGRPDLLEKMTPYGAGALPVTGMIGATTSLKQKNLVPERRKIIADIRTDVFSFLETNKIEYVASEANMFMMNVKRPAAQFASEMTKHKVYIGRPWKVWPEWVRVSVGTRDEMAKFKEACLKVYHA
jgi:histidinol-phosphate aminotransferase